MAAIRHLSRAPITEAVLDLQCDCANKFNRETLAKLGNEIGYPPATEVIQGTQFTLTQTPSEFTQKTDDLGVVGARFFSSDKKFVFLAKNDGVTFSRLPPYSDWVSVFAEASRVWTVFCKFGEPPSVKRIALRFINRISVPAVEIARKPSDFMTPPPSQPDYLDGNAVAWMTRFFIDEPHVETAPGAKAIVTQLGDIASEGPGKYTFIFDIDVFFETALSTEIDELKPRFEQLRALKNRIFFSGLTDKTLEPYV
jgi:uncharacterized protein (TIGR04255 family)